MGGTMYGFSYNYIKNQKNFFKRGILWQVELKKERH